MPHDVMPLALSSNEFDDESLPPDNPSLDNPVNDNSAPDSSPSPQIKGPSLLSMMKKAGRSLVRSAKRTGGKGVLSAIMAAGTILSAPQAALAEYWSNGVLVSGGNPNTGGLQGPGDGSTFGGDPVNIATGNVYLHVTDYKTAGQNPLEFTRYYNSMAGLDGAETTFATTLGNNWRSTYDRYLQISPAASPTTVTAELDNGQQITFTNPCGPPLICLETWVPPSDVDYKLTHSGSTWTLTDHNDTVEVYGDTGTGEGVLSTITSRNGYQQTLNYGASFASIMSNWGTYGPYPVQSVTDSYSRTLSFTYSGGLLQTVTTPDTPTFTYGYTSAGSGNVLTSVTYNTSPSSYQTYAYGASSSPYAITSIVDENGNTSASWYYDGAVRAVLSEQGGNIANSTIFTYNSDNTVTVNNAYGVYDTYTFTPINSVVKVSEIDRAATGTTAAASEYFSYDGNGYLASKTDWNSNTTNYTNNSRGDPTSITEAYGSSVARTTTIAYDSTWVHEPDTITTTGLTRTFTYDGSGNPLTRTDADTTGNSVPYSTNGQTRETQWTWNGTGELTSVQLPRTDVTVKTTIGYTSGVLTSITDQLSHTTSITS